MKGGDRVGGSLLDSSDDDVLLSAACIDKNKIASEEVAKQSSGSLMDEFNPRSKASLLKDADRTGDLYIVCEDGTKVAAHSAILIDLPYFEARLKGTWCSETCWNLNRKLELHLPCSVSQHVVQVFLEYAYRNPKALDKVEPSNAEIWQALFALADACGLERLCARVQERVRITDQTSTSWLKWLEKDHASDSSKILLRTRRVVERKLHETTIWDSFTVEQLLKLDELVQEASTGRAD
ncbi:hypothetical protein KFL_001180300 [Klebsormidium nitens]|uniref:BTB domain-containing protein n=1 Tax=Klebsormidium nitens TaxID=105231 RepID=A0A1Y1I0G6_KLENI|nr:hypothetical protein KFL_001180300 [Klebsormidium nitens]|eukprot:GAQ82651.1 hypothetical protein KFL_001180300 [Klebsormidium nitens]